MGPYASLEGASKARRLEFPFIYNTEERPPLGLGCTSISSEGVCTPAGTQRWPYSGWCLEASDYVRPVSNGRTGEGPGNPRTSQLNCDYLFRAEVDPKFLDQYPSAQGIVQDLVSKADSPRLPQSERPTHWSGLLSLPVGRVLQSKRCARAGSHSDPARLPDGRCFCTVPRETKSGPQARPRRGIPSFPTPRIRATLRQGGLSPGWGSGRPR